MREMIKKKVIASLSAVALLSGSFAGEIVGASEKNNDVVESEVVTEMIVDEEKVDIDEDLNEENVVDNSVKDDQGKIVDGEEVDSKLKKENFVVVQKDGTFLDVKSGHWAYKEIKEMAKGGIITGYQNGTFKPEDSIKRQHVALMFARSLEMEMIRGVTEFKDVPGNHMYADPIQMVYTAGIFDGNNGKFNPDQNLTRAQMAKVLTIAFDLKVKAEYDFPDVSDKHWAKDYIRALYSNGITTGSEGKFKPEDRVTRAQYSVFLHRALNLDPDFVAPPIEQPEQPSTGEKKKVEQIIKENPELFDKDVEIHEFANTSPIISKIMKEGLDVVKETDMMIHDVSSFLLLKQPGYQSHVPWVSYELSLYDNRNGNFTIAYDHYSEQANKIAKSWLKLLAPELTTLEKTVDEKITEGLIAEETGQFFDGNIEVVQIGDYRVRLGLTGFRGVMENMTIEVKLQGN